ncbi:MAG: class I SAM-dependent methyltransferase [candidate division Zixibacteria bacterium]|nr:class I SAM-dependent methyltransferase [candidate division Zixibacteria bacterium]
MILKDYKFYDFLSSDLDLMVSWEKRLKNEAPFFKKLFKESRVKKVLDLACGTGHHSIFFAKSGYEVTGVDKSKEMIKLAKRNSKGVSGIKFFQSSFLEIYPTVKNRFDAVVCLGNSLPHLLSKKDLRKTIQNIYNLLNPEGILIVQNRNYDKILQKKIRFMPPNIIDKEDERMVFLRFLDLYKTKVVFNLVTFRQREGKWSFQTKSTLLRPILIKEIENLLKGVAFKEQKYYGDYSFSPFKRYESEDLIVFARK